MSTPDIDNLQGKLLLAMPDMGDPRFERSAIYILSHNEEGAMGFVVNHPAEGLTLKDILQNMPEEIGRTGLVNMPIFIGGPVQGENGYVLFSADPRSNDNHEVPIQITQSVEILKDAARNRGPAHMRLVLGYAGWGPGQLESELQDNAWLVAAGDQSLIFDPRPEEIWAKAVASLGIDPALLSQSGGEA